MVITKETATTIKDLATGIDFRLLTFVQQTKTNYL